MGLITPPIPDATDITDILTLDGGDANANSPSAEGYRWEANEAPRNSTEPFKEGTAFKIMSCWRHSEQLVGITAYTHDVMVCLKFLSVRVADFFYRDLDYLLISRDTRVLPTNLWFWYPSEFQYSMHLAIACSRILAAFMISFPYQN
jgi:hypothetical protein